MNAGVEFGQADLDEFELSPGAHDVEFAAFAGIEEFLGEFEGFAEEVEVGLGDGALSAHAADFVVGEGDFGGDLEVGVALLFLLDAASGVGGVEAAGDASEDVDFPVGGEAGVPFFAGAGVVGIAVGGASGVGAGEIGGGGEAGASGGAGFALQGAGTADAGAGDVEVAILAAGALEEVAEDGVVEGVPPGGGLGVGVSGGGVG